jgi:hypothetical protein
MGRNYSIFLKVNTKIFRNFDIVREVTLTEDCEQANKIPAYIEHILIPWLANSSVNVVLRMIKLFSRYSFIVATVWRQEELETTLKLYQNICKKKVTKQVIKYFFLIYGLLRINTSEVPISYNYNVLKQHYSSKGKNISSLSILLLG